MFRLNLSLDDPALNLAVDEALLEQIEQGNCGEVLRLWSFAQPVVVLGRGSKFDVEVLEENCRREGVTILRRTSGGATIIAGPGCLLYSVLLSFKERPELRSLDALHSFVMVRLRQAVQVFGIPAECQGICDLTVNNLKVSGNSVRIGREAALYHGTLLCSMPLEWAERCLGTPPRQPEYRQRRSHQGFIANLGLEIESLSEAIADAFDARDEWEQWPETRAAELAASRYSDLAWTRRH